MPQDIAIKSKKEQKLIQRLISAENCQEKRILMNTTSFAIPNVYLIEPKVFGDERGFFFLKASTRRNLKQIASAKQYSFCKITTACSLRGLHYQIQQPQGKLVPIVQGERYLMLWVPEGFAHGFVMLSDTVEFLYKKPTTTAPAFEPCIAWNDPSSALSGPTGLRPQLSAKDQAGMSLALAEVFA